MNSRMPTGTFRYSDSSQKSLVIFPDGLPSQSDVEPPPSSSMLTAPCSSMLCLPSSTSPVAAMLLSVVSTPASCAANRLSASAVAIDHASISSRYWSHTQLTHPLMQQLSGSSGCGGTSTPATSDSYPLWLRGAPRARLDRRSGCRRRCTCSGLYVVRAAVWG